MPNSKQAIPRIVHQTHKHKFEELPSGLSKAVQSWIDTNPEYEHRYYSDKEMSDIMSDVTDTKVQSAYNKLQTLFPEKGALKADLFRLVIVQQYGGVYVDADTMAKTPLCKIINEDDEFVSGIGMRKDLHQWIIIASPNHPFINIALEGTVDNILNTEPPKNNRKLEYWTGPPIYNKTIEDYCKKYASKLNMSPGVHKCPNNPNTYRIVKGDFLGNNVIFKYDGYLNDLKKMGMSHWSS